MFRGSGLLATKACGMSRFAAGGRSYGAAPPCP